MAHRILKVEGMDCNNCALGLRKQLIKSGLEGVEVVFATGEVHYAARSEEDNRLAASVVAGMGYSVVSGTEESDGEQPKPFFGLGHKLVLSLIFTIPLLLAMFLPFDFLHNPWFQFSLTLPVFLIGLWHFGRSAVRSLRAGVPNMDVLIILGSTAAFVYSLVGAVLALGHDYLFFETTASIISLILLGNYLEHAAVRRTTDAVDSLVQMQRTIARRVVVEKGYEKIQEVDATLIRSGEHLVLNTGDTVPVDGEVVEGACSVDESMVSGESVPVEKVKGAFLYGGTHLLSGSIRMRATATGDRTVLSQIIEMVKKAQMDKPPVQSLADKVSAIFVPVVAGIALLTFVITFWIVGAGLQHSLLNSIAVLVIACPCALGLAIPTAVVVGVGRVARSGVLIKGASTIQKLLEVRYIAFDKTGTLTTGDFSVKGLIVYGEGEERRAREFLYSLETHSSHPLAQSLVRVFSGERLQVLEQVEEEKGLGIHGTDRNGDRWSVGSFRLLAPDERTAQHDLYLLKNARLYAGLDLQDDIKPEAAGVMAYLRKQGLVPVLISGDRAEKCTAVARSLGIEKVYSGALPDEKLRIIDELNRQGGVAMVGDGINDAPALTRAAVGISMSNATHAAIRSSQVVLLKGNLNLLMRAHSISKITMKIIRQNLFWAFFYNVLAIPVAALGFLNPMIAAASMALSDVIVVLNSLRLRSKKIS